MDLLFHQRFGVILGVGAKAPTPKIIPKPHFWGPFNAKPIIHRALRKLHVNGATKLKLYSYIGIGKYLGEWGVSKFFEARKLKLKPQLDVVKYSLRVQ